MTPSDPTSTPPADNSPHTPDAQPTPPNETEPAPPVAENVALPVESAAPRCRAGRRSIRRADHRCRAGRSREATRGEYREARAVPRAGAAVAAGPRRQAGPATARPRTHRARPSDPQAAGRSRRAVARRREHRPVHHPLPQGANRRAERRRDPPHPGPRSQPPRAHRPQAAPSSRASRSRGGSPTRSRRPSSRPKHPSGSKTCTCRSSRRRSRSPPRPARRGWGRCPRRSTTATRPSPTCAEVMPGAGRSGQVAAQPRRRDGRRPQHPGRNGRDDAEVRGPLRAFSWDTGVLVATRAEGTPEGKGKEYEPYFDFREPVKEIPPHRVLAINRGEKAGRAQGPHRHRPRDGGWRSRPTTWGWPTTRTASCCSKSRRTLWSG